ncbi:MAG: 30S ribosomal protein S4 [Nitrospiria bacterium]
MARQRGSVCRLCRREGAKLFLKGVRCYTEKCAIERRSYIPGQHGQRRTRTSEYQMQLREKQKLKRIYGLLEQQFHNYFVKAARKKGIAGENLLQMLERRLDNVVYKLGFASSRIEARQLVNHRHIRVNAKTVNIPSFLVKVNDAVEVKPASRKILQIQAAQSAVDGRGIPSWLELQKEHYRGQVKAFPTRGDIALPVNEQLVVELYSR